MKKVEKVIQKGTLTLEEQTFLAEMFMLADKYTNDETLFDCTGVCCGECPLHNHKEWCCQMLLEDIVEAIKNFKEKYSNKDG